MFFTDVTLQPEVLFYYYFGNLELVSPGNVTYVFFMKNEVGDPRADIRAYMSVQTYTTCIA